MKPLRILCLGLWVGFCVSGVLAQNHQVVDAFYARDFGTARLLAESSWRMAKGRGDMLEAGLASANIGACLTMLGQFDEARMWQQRALELFEKQGSTSLVGQVNIARAITEFLHAQQYGKNNVGNALVYLDLAKNGLGAANAQLARVGAEIRRGSGDPHLEGLGYREYVALIDLFRQGGEHLAKARCAVRLACLDGKRGAHDTALNRCLMAAEIFKTEGEVGEAAFALRNAGHAHRKLGDYTLAEKTLKEALDAARKSGQASIELRVLDDLSRLYAEMDQYDLAIDFDEQADALLYKIAKSVPQGYAADSVSLSLQHLLLLRFASVIPYEADRFAGFYDALILQIGQ